MGLLRRSVPKAGVHHQTVKNRRNLSLRRLAAYGGAALGVLVLAGVVLLFAFGDAMLNRYGKAKAERAFARAHPWCALQIGQLNYFLGANRLVAQSVTLVSTHTTLKAGRISLRGVRWTQLLWGTAVLEDVLAQSSLEATKIDVRFSEGQYGFRCERLRVSVPDSELTAEKAELWPSAGDEAFFAAHAFRTPRFRVVLPECRVSGLAFGELFQGRSFRAGSVHFPRPSFEALLNRDKPLELFVKSPLMVHEALASIRQPLEIGRVTITNGGLRYCERLAVGAEPAVLTFGAVNLSIQGIANRGDAAAAIQLQGQGDLMEAGTVQVRMTIPILSTNFSLHYSGSLNAMDLTRLDPFLEIAESTRIKSGSAQEAAFEIDVTAGHARGSVRAIYRDLEIAVLDEQTGSAAGLGNRVASFLANVLKIRNANPPKPSDSSKVGEVNYTRKPDEPFQQFLWFALRSGVMDVISH